MQLKLLQAKQEETQGAIRREEEEGKVRETFKLLCFSACPSVCLSVSVSVSLCFVSLVEAILYLPAFVGRG